MKTFNEKFFRIMSMCERVADSMSGVPFYTFKNIFVEMAKKGVTSHVMLCDLLNKLENTNEITSQCALTFSKEELKVKRENMVNKLIEIEKYTKVNVTTQYFILYSLAIKDQVKYIQKVAEYNEFVKNKSNVKISLFRDPIIISKLKTIQKKVKYEIDKAMDRLKKTKDPTVSRASVITR